MDKCVSKNFARGIKANKMCNKSIEICSYPDGKHYKFELFTCVSKPEKYTLIRKRKILSQ